MTWQNISPAAFQHHAHLALDIRLRFLRTGLSLTGIIIFFSIESTSIFFGRKNGVRFLDTRARPKVIIGMFF